MKTSSIVGVVACCLSLWGCASNVKYASAPSQVVGAGAAASTTVAYTVSGSVRPPAEVIQDARSIDTHRPIYYFQQNGGGGVALGLLLGPIGAAANYKMIQSNTDKDAQALMGRVPLDPASSMESAAKTNKLLLEKADVNGYQLKPYLMIIKSEKNQLLIATAIDASKGSWKGRYVYHLASTRDYSTFTGTMAVPTKESLSTEMTKGYAKALELFVADARGKLHPGRDITFKTEAVSPRFNLPMVAKLVSDDGANVVVLGAGDETQFTSSLAAGYHALPKSSVEIANR